MVTYRYQSGRALSEPLALQAMETDFELKPNFILIKLACFAIM